MKKIVTEYGLMPLIGFIEFFERFGFYTMQGILVLFLIKTKHFSSTDAFHIYGAFFSLVYAFVGFGGLCGDKVLGPQKTILLGLFIMLFGYLGLSTGIEQVFFPSLAAVCVGNALFKANPANMIGKIYQQDKSKLHSAFTIFYMSVNLGALLALVIGPLLSSKFNYQYAFFASAFGIFVAIVAVFKNTKILRLATGENNFIHNKFLVFGGLFIFIISMWLSTSYLIFYYEYVIIGLKLIIVFALGVFIFSGIKEPVAVKRRLLAVLILMIEAVVFFTLYNQMPTSINLYAVLHVKSQLLGFTFDPQSFQALNPFWIIVWSPLLAKFYINNAKSRFPLSIFHKFSFGMLSVGISYLILYFSHFYVDQNLMISPLWLVSSYIFQALAELLVSALGLAMVAELVPASWMGGVMGMWFLTSAVSGFTGASLASLIAIPKNMQASYASLNQFAMVFYEIAIVVILISFVMFLSIRLMKKLIK